MAVTAADLTYPQGELKADYFPGEDLETLLNAWIAEGESRTSHISDADTRDRAVEAYVYCRAFGQVGNRMASLPRAESYYGDVSRSWDDRNISHWRKAAEPYCSLFQSLVSVRTQATVRRQSNVTQNRPVF